MSLYYYTTILPERPLEPPGINEPEPDAEPSCQCSKCGQDVWPGEYTFGDGACNELCRECFEELLRDMMKHNISEMAELLGYDVNLV